MLRKLPLTSTHEEKTSLVLESSPSGIPLLI